MNSQPLTRLARYAVVSGCLLPVLVVVLAIGWSSLVLDRQPPAARPDARPTRAPEPPLTQTELDRWLEPIAAATTAYGATITAEPMGAGRIGTVRIRLPVLVPHLDATELAYATGRHVSRLPSGTVIWVLVYSPAGQPLAEERFSSP